MPDLIRSEGDLCKNQTVNESVLAANHKNVDSGASDVQILVSQRC